MRKTVRITDMIDNVNRKNENSTCSSDVRRGWNGLLADVLHATGMYAGFGYLREGHVPEGHKPGIIFDSSPEHKHEYPDESRVFYYYSRKLGK